jgi:hypothetical protein
MAVKRMDNAGSVVADVDAAIAFSVELDLELEGRAPIEGDWVGSGAVLREGPTSATSGHRHPSPLEYSATQNKIKTSLPTHDRRKII